MSVVGHHTRPATPKKSRHPARSGDSEELKANQRDRYGHPAARCHRSQRQRYHRRCPSDPTQAGRLLGRKRHAHYHFTVKANQPSLLTISRAILQGSQTTRFRHARPARSWTHRNPTRSGPPPNSTAISTFPMSAKPSLIERIPIDKKTGKSSRDIAYGITSRSPTSRCPSRLLEINRGHWTIENSCHYILDWNYDEDRCRIRTGYGPENITRLRRFAIGVIKSKGARQRRPENAPAQQNTRLVFDYLRMTVEFSRPHAHMKMENKFTVGRDPGRIRASPQLIE